MLLLKIQTLGNTVVLRCVGRLIRGEELNLLRTTALGCSDSKMLILDLTDLSSIDGGGLGLLASLEQWAQDKGLHLRVQNPSPIVRQVLKVTNLDSVLEIGPATDNADTFHDSLPVEMTVQTLQPASAHN